jgi:hypothetical protein
MAGLSAERVAAARLAGMQRLARAVASVADDAWSRVDPADIVRSWLRLLGRPLAALVGAQDSAAQTADVYVDEVLAAQGADAAPAGAVVAGRLAGVASDGRPLETLLQQPAIRTLQALSAGATQDDALTVGRLSLDMIMRTQVADAGRTATGVALAARGVGYVRMLNPPSCSRCVILAGQFYRWNDGFERHPRCDCIHVPAVEDAARDLTTDPRGYFDSLSTAEQDRTFTIAGAEAIRDGADIGQVVNARRGMSTAAGPSGRRRLVPDVTGRFTTTESTGRRGVARRGRLMPEQIYLDADGDRTEALRLLELHGYLVRRPVAVAVPPRATIPAPAVKATPPRPQPATGADRFEWALDHEDELVQALESTAAGDGALARILAEQGFDGAPELVDELPTGLLPLYRGVDPGMAEWDVGGLTGAAMNEQFRTGGLFPGLGLYGNGTYFSISREVAEVYGGAGYGDLPPGNILVAALRPDARVIDYDELLAEIRREGLSESVLADPGRYAASRGYDAIRVDGHTDGSDVADASGRDHFTQYVVLNRRALVVVR